MSPRGYVLDAGAFIGVERGDPRMREYLREFHTQGTPIATSAGVVAQIWRGGVRKQLPIAFLLRRAEVVDLTDSQARVVGTMLGISGTRDPVDAHIALIAGTRDWPVLTSVAADLRAVDRSLDLYDI